jgi:hypothetical protein
MPSPATLLLAALAPVVAERGPFPDPAVIALAGGEDVVVAQELGYFEAGLLAAQPEAHWRLRGLAREGDTVFEQPRPPGHPPWEEELRSLRVSVVVAQFGLSEGVARVEPGEFARGYGELVRRWQSAGAEVWMVGPSGPAGLGSLDALRGRLPALAAELGAGWIPVPPTTARELRGDGLHLNPAGQRAAAGQWLAGLALSGHPPATERLIGLVRDKNRLWAEQWWPRNLAYRHPPLAGRPAAQDPFRPGRTWPEADQARWPGLVDAAEDRIRRVFRTPLEVWE